MVLKAPETAVAAKLRPAMRLAVSLLVTACATDPTGQGIPIRDAEPSIVQPTAIPARSAATSSAAVGPGPPPSPTLQPTSTAEPPRRIEGSFSSGAPRYLEAEAPHRLCVYIVRCLISEEGRVVEIDFLKPEEPWPELAEALRRQLPGWRFEPARRDGVPVAHPFYLTLHHAPCRKP